MTFSATRLNVSLRRIPWDRPVPLQCRRVSSHLLWQRGSNGRDTQPKPACSSVQRCSRIGRSHRVASGRATELTFPRNKFHLVRGQITDVMRMVGAVGNYGVCGYWRSGALEGQEKPPRGIEAGTRGRDVVSGKGIEGSTREEG